LPYATPVTMANAEQASTLPINFRDSILFFSSRNSVNQKVFVVR
jgi:hypothetical protein